MRCPYCVSEIADEALACPRCARDLYLFKPLLAKIEQLEKSVGEQAKAAAANAEARIAALEKELADLKAEQANLIPVEVMEVPAGPQEAKPGYLGTVVQMLVPALILLVAAHGFLLFVYDVKPLYLRVATILIPVPFGYYLALNYPDEFRKSVFAAVVLALAGVFAMLGVTAVIDKVPLLPQDLRDWRETLEYVLSIALAFVTGLLLGKHKAHRNVEQVQKNRFVLLLTRAFTPNEEGKLGIEKAYKKVNKMVESVTPAATGAASVYAGIKTFFGDLG
jgi:hypothetical protein